MSDRAGAVSSVMGSDLQLLERFRAHGEEEAFTRLVERYRGAVWSVCRRILRQEDAEDAFQATFLVLARKAGSIRKGEAVGSWLYGVAYRTAMKARYNAARRQGLEKRVVRPDQPGDSPVGEAACRELQRLLDEEVARLAEKYRAPFVLCCLEGLSRAEAASELGWKEGTVSGRLAQARKLLQSRLARRGVKLSSALTAVALTQSALTAAAPVLPLGSVLQSSTGGVSAKAVTLADSLMRAMTLARLKAVFALSIAAAVLLCVIALATYHLVLVDDEPMFEPELFLRPPVALGTIIDEQVLALAFSPDGKRLVTGGGKGPLPGQLKIWDIGSKKDLVTLRRIPAIRAVAFSADGLSLATGDNTGAIHMRDPGTGEEQMSAAAHPGGVQSLAFSADGSLLISSGLDQTCKVWSVPALKERTNFQGHTGLVVSVASFHHAQIAVTGGRDRSANVWDLAAGKRKFTLAGLPGSVEAVAVSHDDRIIATVGGDGIVMFWDAGSGAEIGVLEKGSDLLFAASFSPDGKWFAAAGVQGSVQLWDVTTRKSAGRLEKHGAAVWALQFSPDGTRLASGSSDKTVKLWTLNGLGEETTLAMSWSANKPVLAVAYAPDGSAIAVATRDHTLHVREAKSGDVLHVMAGHSDDVTCLAFSPNSQTLVSGSKDKTIKLWDWGAGKHLRTFEGHTGAVLAVCFTMDGQKLASAGADEVIRLWNPDDGKILGAMEGHTAAISALAMSPDGAGFASGSADGALRAWFFAKEKKPFEMKGHDGPVRSLAFAADGTLASGSEDGTIKIWLPPPGKKWLELKGHKGPVRTLVFPPGGRSLLSAGDDKKIFVWDPRLGKARDIFDGHNDPVTSLAVHPRGKDFISGSLDTRILRWLAVKETPVRLAGAKNGETLAVAAKQLLLQQKTSPPSASADTSQGETQASAPWKKWIFLAGALTVLAPVILALLVWRRRRLALTSTSEANGGPFHIDYLALTCSGCGKRLKIKGEAIGRKVKCPVCGESGTARLYTGGRTR